MATGADNEAYIEYIDQDNYVPRKSNSDASHRSFFNGEFGSHIMKGMFLAPGFIGGCLLVNPNLVTDLSGGWEHIFGTVSSSVFGSGSRAMSDFLGFLNIFVSFGLLSSRGSGFGLRQMTRYIGLVSFLAAFVNWNDSTNNLHIFQLVGGFLMAYHGFFTAPSSDFQQSFPNVWGTSGFTDEKFWFVIATVFTTIVPLMLLFGDQNLAWKLSLRPEAMLSGASTTLINFVAISLLSLGATIWASLKSRSIHKWSQFALLPLALNLFLDFNNGCQPLKLALDAFFVYMCLRKRNHSHSLWHNLVWNIVHYHNVFWGLAMLIGWQTTGNFWGVNSTLDNDLVRNICGAAFIATGLAAIGARRTDGEGYTAYTGQATRLFSQALAIANGVNLVINLTQKDGQTEQGRQQGLWFTIAHVAFYVFHGFMHSTAQIKQSNMQSFPWPKNMKSRSHASQFFSFACMGYFVISFLFFFKPELAIKLMWFNDMGSGAVFGLKNNFSNLSSFWTNFIGSLLLTWCLTCWAALRTSDVAVKNWCKYTFFAFFTCFLVNWQAGAAPLRLLQDAAFTFLTFKWGHNFNFM